MVIGTGEIKEYQQTDTKQADSLRKTFTNLRQLINTNFHVNDSELFLTLTYAENMQDPERLYTDYKKFFMRLRYSLENRGVGLYCDSRTARQGRMAFTCAAEIG